VIESYYTYAFDECRFYSRDVSVKSNKKNTYRPRGLRRKLDACSSPCLSERVEPRQDEWVQ
jgi:hypothetical protein